MQHRGFLLLALLTLLALTSAGAKKKADCKYKFESWGACDGGTGTKARQGTLKKARYNAQCQETIRVTKPCTPKTKAKAKAKKGKGKD
uniref:Midkine n=1 Tax=Ailuropoda melanoleuca TaxID=9646 RepID=A0A7N5JX64_AILME